MNLRHRRQGVLTTTLGLILVAAPTVDAQTATDPRSAVRDSITKSYERYIRGFATQDAATVAAVYDSVRGARLGDNGEVVRGRADITTDLARFLRQVGPVRVVLHTDGLWLVDDRAYEAGTWSYTFTPPGRNSARRHCVAERQAASAAE